MNQEQEEAKPTRIPETDRSGGEDLWQRHKAEPLVWSERMLLALETGKEGRKWYSLIDKVHREATLGLAWAKVLANAGACGVDGITVARFQKDSQTGLLALNKQLREGSYQPKSVKRVWIPKLGSAQKRPLGVPTVADRVVQTATRMVIEPIFEREFAENSYGFRPGRRCQDALRHVYQLLQSGHAQVVDIDIKGYFDAIPHEKLLAKVKEKIADSRVLGLIEAFLQAAIMDEGKVQANEEGTPQGGVISPLLANIYLNDLDWQMKNAGYEMMRYADDMVVLCRDAAQAQAALARVKSWMEEAQLELHPEKTKIVDMGQPGGYFDFLGYRFWKCKNGEIRPYIRPKSRKKLRDNLRPHTRRNNGNAMETIFATINPILKGWYSYFKHARVEALRETDGWVRGRIRSILRKRSGRRGRGRGRDHQDYNNDYLAKLGLFSMEEARAREILNRLRKE